MTAGVRTQRDPGQKAASFWVKERSRNESRHSTDPGVVWLGQPLLSKPFWGLPPTSHQPSRGAPRLSAPSKLGKGVIFLPGFSLNAQRPAQYHCVLARLEVLPPSL